MPSPLPVAGGEEGEQDQFAAHRDKLAPRAWGRPYIGPGEDAPSDRCRAGRTPCRAAPGAGAVLQAPPGAGKTTRVPLALLEPWLGGRKIVMLEPRRLAARAAARCMARPSGEEAGATVGYRIRLDTRVASRTRIEVVTEGILTRMSAGSRARGVGLVIFDEFHERSLHADLGLALALETQAILRPDLRILVMSATLDGERVAALLGDAPVVTSEGRRFPVEMRYARGRADGASRPRVARAIAARCDDDGDVLVFLPGAGEIRRVAVLLGGSEQPRSCPCTAPSRPAQQDRRSVPMPAGAARWCWPPPSPRPASPSTACASWSMPG